MVVAGVQSVINAQALLAAGSLGEDWARQVFRELMTCKDQFHVLESELTASAHLLRPSFFKLAQHLPGTLRADQPNLDLGTDKMSDDGLEEVTSSALKCLLLTIDREDAVLGFNVRPDLKRLADEKFHAAWKTAAGSVGDRLLTELAPEIPGFVVNLFGFEGNEEL